MDLENHVRAIMRYSAKALTVSQVASELSKQIEEEVRAVLNRMLKNGELTSVHGGGSYQTCYRTPELRRV
jgi:predicted transcriptional regulator